MTYTQTLEARHIADQLDQLSSSHRPLLTAASKSLRELASLLPITLLEAEMVEDALRSYDPHLYGPEKWETTLANIRPLLAVGAEALRRPLLDALKPFAAAADTWVEMGDTRPIDQDGLITVGDLRRAATAIRSLSASPADAGVEG